ncbi:NUDIX hydrolase [Vibrio furnissii]|uniref:NUDIX hydrolase n=1 Tax=Vibrio TaxID=662 RepID=UPI001E3E4AF4|nr:MULTISPECIES: NUDIX domain-containing protein [Bacteria]MCC2999901.1 NUDIX domain-containing protein [Campylobacter jejuni]MCF9988335.1 NUDIX domain-containing protein [Campylobacter jejuni]MCG6268769.1 NUDIX domain-containing protein [Vibrio furnissii]UHJ63323.1 NUDIX domain-containing protein [Vibrio furnissii]
MDVFECVSFMLVNDGKILLEKRSASKTHDPNMVAIPGGHIEVGESQTDALLRELDEELAVLPQQSVYLCSLYHPTGELQLLHYYVIPQWCGEIACHEAEAVFWADIDPSAVETDADRLAILEYQRLYASGVLSLP